MLLGVVFDRAFAAAAGVDLGFDDGERAAELLERGGGFVGGGGHDALRHGDAGFAQQLLGLVFVNLHLGTLEIAAAINSGYAERSWLTQRRNRHRE